MALLGTGTTGSGSPKLAYELYADNVGGSGTRRTIRITVKFKVNGGSASYYGYPVTWQPRIQTPYEFVFGSWQSVKGTETWNGGQGWRQYSQDISFDSKSTGSISVVPGFEVKSTSGGEWNGSVSHGNFGTSTTNTAPYFPSGSSVVVRANDGNGAVLGGTIPENIGKFHISWSAANDNEGGTLRYWVCENYNNSGWNIKYNGGTDRAYSFNTNTGNEGATYQFYVDCRDSSDALSGKIYSSVLTRNKLTQATLNSSSYINYDTGSISFTYRGANNTNGNTSFTYKLSCNEVTVYNQTLTSTPATVTIYKSGTVPSGCYIKFEDIKNKFKDSSYKGTLNFTLSTTNAYGTTKTSSKTISVDLRTAPNAVSSCSISGDKSLSTCIKTTADTSGNYFVPNGSGVVRVVWSGGSCKLGGSFTYDVQVKYGSGAFVNVATGLSSATTYYNHVVPTQTTSQTLTYRIITKTGFGYTSYRDTAAVTLHYYNAPTITIGTITRAETTASVVVTVKTNSSIPNINTKGSWKMTTTNQTGSLSVSQTAQTINTTGLTGNGTYTLSITYNDKTGFSADKVYSVSIGTNLPVLDVNKYGIGVNGAVADSNTALNVKGKIKAMNINAKETLPTNANLNNYTTNGFYVTGSDGESANITNRPPTTAGFDLEVSNVWANATNGGRVLQKATIRSTNVTYIRNRDENLNWTGWTKYYTENSKPTPAEIGALPLGGGTMTGNLTVPTVSITNGGLAISNNSVVFNHATNEQRVHFNNASSSKKTAYFYKGASTSETVVGLYDASSGTTGGVWRYKNNNEFTIEKTTYLPESITIDKGAYFSRAIPTANKVNNTNHVRIGALAGDAKGSLKIQLPNGAGSDGGVEVLNGDWNKALLRVSPSGAVSCGEKFYGKFVTDGRECTGGSNVYYFTKASDYIHVECNDGGHGISYWGSDAYLKTNIDFTEETALDKIMQIEHAQFDWIQEERGHQDLGYVAQQLELINPKWTLHIPQKDGDETLQVEVKEIFPYVTKAMQEQQELILTQCEEISELKTKNEELENRLKSIEEKMGLE